MKKIICLLGLLSCLTFAQGATMADSDVGYPDPDFSSMSASVDHGYSNTSANDLLNFEANPVGAILLIIFMIGIYIAMPICIYVIGSYGLSLLDMKYQKKERSGISWVPFARYYTIVRNATKSEKKAFYITIFPWLVVAIGIIGFFIGAISYGISAAAQGATDSLPVLSMIFAGIGFIGLLGVVAMNFWRAFIISNYIKGDTTTAFGLATYTSIVLWYVGLDRMYQKTDIIGKIGFIVMAVVAILYVLIFASFIYAAVVGAISSI